MKQLLMRATSGPLPPERLRRDLQRGRGRELRLRRGVVGVSLLGIAAMGIVTLLQTGLVRHLPDPPLRRPRFDSDKVNSSQEAYGYGMPDGPLTLAAHAANIVIASAGPADRYRRRPWLPILASLVALPQAAIAAKYLFHQMPKVDKAWCPYCVTDALVHFATLGLTLPEARRALRGN